MINQGSAHDIAAIMPVMQDAFDPAFGEAWTSAQCLALLTMPDSRLLLAWSDSHVVGFAISRWIMDEEELLMIGVKTAFQGQRIGRKILDEIIQQAKCAKRKKIFIEVRNGNPAKYFYDKLEFSEIGRRKDYYNGKDGLKYDAITMEYIV